jgi:hypothetical protein
MAPITSTLENIMTEEKATTKKTHDQLTHEIVACNSKGQQYEAASGVHFEKAWNMYTTAGLALAELKVLTGGGAPWIDAYEKCGLKNHGRIPSSPLAPAQLLWSKFVRERLGG